MGVSGVLAILIFVAMFVLIVWDRIERHIVTLGCAAATLIVVFGISMRSISAVWKSLNLQSIFTAEFWYEAGTAAESSVGVNWSTILFIFGMMVMVEGMAGAGFFRWLCMLLARLVHYKIVPLFIVFMLMSAGLAMFIDSITVILFFAAITVELSRLLKFDPVPMILTEIFCANLGGSATMCGDPPNIIIGTSLGYSFSDFIVNTGLLAGIGLIAAVIYFYFTLRKQFQTTESEVDVTAVPKPGEVISSKREFVLACVIFTAAVVLLVTHAQSGLTVACIGCMIAAVTLIVAGKNIPKILKAVDYKTLLFFVGLFIVVSGLEETGVLELLANFIGVMSNGNVKLMIAIIIWISAICSAFVDNIPFAATMIPVIRSLAATQGVDLSTLAWTLAIGTDIGGSATPIGASANVVGTSVAAKNGHIITWGKYCKISAPATILVIGLSMLLIFVRYC